LSTTDGPLRGVYPILAMPFDPVGRIDTEILRREVEFMVAAGVHGVGIALASEVPMLTEAERDLALRVVVEQARRRVRVVMNTGAAGTDLAIHYSRRAEALGADAVMVLPPPTGTTSDETLGYFRGIASSIRIPIVVQDAAHSPVPPALAARLAASAEHDWYLKVETPPTAPRVAEAKAVRDGRLGVFGGAGGIAFLQELRRGAQGTMPGSAIPDIFVRIWDLFQAGELDKAEALFARCANLLNLLSQGTGILFYLYKEVLRLRGIFTDIAVRKPAAEPDPIAYEELRHEVELLGLTGATKV
jgi:dihydrodipicolinate synthase/N-acetylneuraminate lyase